jgi:hypothetical protein
MDENLEKLRKNYLQTKTPNFLKDWDSLQTELVAQDLSSPSPQPFFRLALASFGLLIFLSSVVGLAQASTAGQSLYSVKLLTDQVIAKVTNQPELPLEKRADEVVKFSQNPQSPQLNQAASQYQKSLEQAKKDATQEGKSNQFKQALDQQTQKFEQSIKNNPSSEQKIQPLIEQTEKVRGEVQGTHTQIHSDQGDHNGSNNSNNSNNGNHGGSNKND